MELIFNLTNIKQAAQQFNLLTAGYCVFALHGEMGAGKTTFVHALCDELGVQNAVSSPTFSIINEYTTAAGKTIYHLDLYRLKSVQEAIDVGVEDCFYSGNLCLVEWPEIAPAIFPEDTLHVHIEIAGNDKRRLVIREVG